MVLLCSFFLFILSLQRVTQFFVLFSSTNTVLSVNEYTPFLGVDRLSAPILSILPIIDIGHFQNRFAANFLFYFIFLCKQTYYLQVTLFIGE